MKNNNGKYMVNFEGQERWYGHKFDTQEEAIAEARNALINKEDDNDVFGEKLSWYTLDEMGTEAYEQTHFMIGRVQSLSTPMDLGKHIVEYLDEVCWEDETFEDDRPSQYVFDDESIEELNKLLADWLKPKVDKANYYVVDILGKIPIQEETK